MIHAHDSMLICRFLVVVVPSAIIVGVLRPVARLFRGIGHRWHVICNTSVLPIVLGPRMGVVGESTYCDSYEVASVARTMAKGTNPNRIENTGCKPCKFLSRTRSRGGLLGRHQTPDIAHRSSEARNRCLRSLDELSHSNQGSEILRVFHFFNRTCGGSLARFVWDCENPVLLCKAAQEPHATANRPTSLSCVRDAASDAS